MSDEWEGYKEGYLNNQIKDYHRLDAGLSYSFNFQNKKIPSTKVGLNFINIYNFDNVIKNQYFIDYRDDTPKINLLERKGMPFTWNLSLDLKF